MSKKLTKIIIAGAIAGVGVAGNATASEAEYSFGKQSDNSYYKLVQNGNSTTWRIEQVNGNSKKTVIENIGKDGSVYVTGYNGALYKVDGGNMSTMVNNILSNPTTNTGPYNKNGNGQNAAVKEYIDKAADNAEMVSQAVSGTNPALGKDAQASDEYAVAVGEGANSGGKGTTAVGAYSASLEKFGTVVGHASQVYASAATAVGTAASVGNKAVGGTAVGMKASSEGVGSVAAGVGAKATHENSVALGAYSRTTRNNEVNIAYVPEGKEAQTRVLGGLSDGTLDTDAATVGQTKRNIDEKTLVGVDSDGTLTDAENATKTIAVNDGLVALSGRTDRIDAAVGGIDTRVTKNTQAIQSNSRQLQEHNARLNSQQNQIRENHEEMKRAAAQSAALAGLFQPYSVGKFNATAALGGYSDKQAVAVGVGYRFNEQTAAKAAVAASDGDVSYNVGVNFEF
ncbi:hypothetical protein J2T26_004857 [Citrobacter farmeri]|uniref:YadA-like family protein n=1 Tax=Citrobacter farmeri TaxID=67824 RepID=UPI0020A06A19|nr:YadA-like family protein [Citrobacter farmeri]MCP1694947.1 hypothetical protein [Citrobacter farmeri]MCW2425056.1 hypothetical protein [Citrobacter farmeri]